MTTETSNLAQEHAALNAKMNKARTENLAIVAALSDVANDVQIEEHIRGMVAVTMGHRPVEEEEEEIDDADDDD